jgi:hypothetical protein
MGLIAWSGQTYASAGWGLIASLLAYGGYRLLRRRSSPARSAAAGLWVLNTLLIAGWSAFFSSAAEPSARVRRRPEP